MNHIAQQIAEQSRLPEYKGVYILGCFERRVTFHTQQLRALNLVWSLFESNFLGEKKKRVAIIGAGLAGITAAIAAKRKGCEVTLFERTSNVMTLQRGNTSRFVHPNIYDWPKQISSNSSTDLPFLNWEAGEARDIVKKIELQFNELKQGIKLHFNTKIACVNDDLIHELLIIPDKPNGIAPFDCVIVAVGFGVENKIEHIQFQSYWDNDNFNQPERNPKYERENRNAKYLVSGCGDGGLIDLHRLVIEDFDHTEFTKMLITLVEHDQRLLRSLNDIENDMASLKDEDKSFRIFQQYETLEIPEAFIKSIKIYKGREVTLHGKEILPLNFYASVLNRFATYVLLKNNAFTYVRGELEIINYKGGYRVIIRNGMQESENYYDHVVVRRGPTSLVQSLFLKPINQGYFTQTYLSQISHWSKNYYDSNEPDYDSGQSATDVKPVRPLSKNEFITARPGYPTDFIGRQDELKKIIYLLTKFSLTIISGEAGEGKSSLALKYVQDQEDLSVYNTIAWIDVRENFLEDFVLNFSKTSELRFPEMYEYREQFFSIVAALNKYEGKNLMVIDGMDSEKDIAEYLEILKLNHWHSIITTRSKVNGDQSIRLEGLPLKEARQLFHNNYDLSAKKVESTKIDGLIEQVNNNSLLIELLSQIGNAKNLDLKQLAQLVHSSQGPSTGSNLEKVLDSLLREEEMNEVRQQILGFLCVFPDNSKVSELLLIFDKVFQPTSDQMIVMAIKVFLDYGIIVVKKSAPDESETVGIHQLVREMLAKKILIKKEYLTVVSSSLSNLLKANSASADSFLPYGKSVFDFITLNDEAQIELGLRLVYAYKQRDGLSTSFQILWRCALINVATRQPEVIEWLGYHYQSFGNLDKALEFYKSAIRLDRKLHQNNPDKFKRRLAVHYDELGDLYKIKGDLKNALKEFRKLEETTKDLIKKHPTDQTLIEGAAISSSKIGNVYRESGKLQISLRLFVKWSNLSGQFFCQIYKSILLLLLFML